MNTLRNTLHDVLKVLWELAKRVEETKVIILQIGAQVKNIFRESNQLVYYLAN